MKWLIFILLPLVCLAESKEEIIQRYTERYEDFFERLRQEEARNAERLSGRSVIKEKRQEWAELHERARKRFIESRPVPKDLSKAYQAYLEQEAADKQAYLKLQERYAKMQREIDKIKEGAIKIPPVLEYELQDKL